MHQQQAAQLARIISATVYPPGEKPVTFDETHIAGAGVQDGVAILAAVDDQGNQVQFFNVPMKIVKTPPSGLVAPVGGPPLRAA